MHRSLVLVALLAGAATASPAPAETRDYPLAGFDRVQLDAVAEVTVTAGPRFAVRADGDPELIEKLAPRVDNGILLIDWVKGVRHVQLHDRKLHVAVTLPRVAGVGVRGTGSLTLDRAESADFVAALSGVGSIDIGAIKAGHAVLTMSGTGKIAAKDGVVERLDIRRSGIGSIEVAGVTAKSGDVSNSGTGSVEARYDGPVTVSQSGIGSVEIKGHAQCSIHKSGIGSVDCG